MPIFNSLSLLSSVRVGTRNFNSQIDAVHKLKRFYLEMQGVKQKDANSIMDVLVN